MAWASAAWSEVAWGSEPASGATVYTLTAASGSFTLTGTAAALKFNRILSAGSGVFLLTGTNSTLTYSGAPPPANAILYLDLISGKVLLLKPL